MLTGTSHPASYPAITLRIPDACRATGIGRSKLYDLIKLGEIDTIKIGRITLIPVTSIERLIARCSAPALTDEREKGRQIISMHPFLANAVITAALASMTDQVRGSLNSADQLTRSKAEDGLAARIVEALLEVGAKDDGRYAVLPLRISDDSKNTPHVGIVSGIRQVGESMR